MPLYEYHCPACGHAFDEVSSFDARRSEVPCPLCKGPAFYRFSVGSVDLESEGATWIKSVTEVVDPDNGPTHREFVRNPNRATMRAWMQETGLRHKEPGEPIRKPRPDMKPLYKQMAEAHRKRMRIEI
jgi:putative FmdB family regulatory protein